MGQDRDVVADEVVDLVILGGGCAGLSLGLALALRQAQTQTQPRQSLTDTASACQPTVVILESRSTYTQDRTWCFWPTEVTRAQGLDALAAHRWLKLRVSTTNTPGVLLDYTAWPYAMVNAHAFYEHAVAAIAGTDNIRLRLGEPALHCERGSHQWRVHTAQGVLRCNAVLDTRPIAVPVEGGALLWQSFYGVEVESTQAVFDAACADLMDFAPASDEEIRFTYVLPTSAQRALIEMTVFSPQPLGPQTLAAQLDAALAQRTRGAAFTRLRSEHGVLPMGSTPMAGLALPAAQPGYVYAGLTAGGARAATGYAFVRIQQWAIACAQALAQGQGPLGHAPDSWIQSRMDQLFLQVIRTHPQAAPELFRSLFQRAGAHRMARFLSDQASLLDRAVIASSLPPGLFVGQLARQAQRAYRQLGAAKVSM